MTDIVERLRAIPSHPDYQLLVHEAADEIARLRIHSLELTKDSAVKSERLQALWVAFQDDEAFRRVYQGLTCSQ